MRKTDRAYPRHRPWQWSVWDLAAWARPQPVYSLLDQETKISFRSVVQRVAQHTRQLVFLQARCPDHPWPRKSTQNSCSLCKPLCVAHALWRLSALEIWTYLKLILPWVLSLNPRVLFRDSLYLILTLLLIILILHMSCLICCVISISWLDPDCYRINVRSSPRT